MHVGGSSLRLGEKGPLVGGTDKLPKDFEKPPVYVDDDQVRCGPFKSWVEDFSGLSGHELDLPCLRFARKCSGCALVGPADIATAASCIPYVLVFRLCLLGSAVGCGKIQLMIGPLHAHGAPWSSRQKVTKLSCTSHCCMHGADHHIQGHSTGQVLKGRAQGVGAAGHCGGIRRHRAIRHNPRHEQRRVHGGQAAQVGGLRLVSCQG